MKRTSITLFGTLLASSVIALAQAQPMGGPHLPWSVPWNVTIKGNLGVGTQTPAARLHVRDFIDEGPIIIVENVSLKGDIPIDFRAHGELVGNVGVVQDAGPGMPRRFFVLQNNPYSLHLTLSEQGYGNVGIALTNPLFRLDVNGDVNTTGCYRQGGHALMGACPSDAKLKSNVEPLSNSLEKISALQPVRFEWRDNQFPDRRSSSTARETGLIGQDVEAVLPELVTTDANGLKRVQYGLELEMHMIQAIRELKALNDELRAKVSQLERQLSEGRSTSTTADWRRLPTAGHAGASKIGGY